MNNYQSTIGLEIHVELKTRSKMFCGCVNNPDEKNPNTNVCPVCLAHPGVLPVINKKAVESVLKLGLALDSEIPQISKFDRKNYFYPDLPKGYQISQYDQPLVVGGKLNDVKLTRIHLEEDTGRLIHSSQLADYPQNEIAASLIDFNRAGVPLMELVTEPDIKSGDQAVTFAKELQMILRYLDISNANMEKGEMRVEANISVSAGDELGTKVEIKNLNSFKVLGDSINYEIKRQIEVLEKGDEVHHETRGWNDNKKITVSQRIKEKAHDYRYFSEPDLPPMDIKEFDLEKLKLEIPELPEQKRKRFISEFGLKSEQVEIFIEDYNLADYFEKAISELLAETNTIDTALKIQLLFNYLTSDIKGLMNELGGDFNTLKITPPKLALLVALIVNKKLPSRLAKDILKEMFESGLEPEQIMNEKGLSQISDQDIIKKTIQEIIAENPVALEDYKKGKQNASQFLIGQAMKKLKGQANPDILKKLLEEYLSK